jgi:hypothetical protein
LVEILSKANCLLFFIVTVLFIVIPNASFHAQNKLCRRKVSAECSMFPWHSLLHLSLHLQVLCPEARKHRAIAALMAVNLMHYSLNIQHTHTRSLKLFKNPLFFLELMRPILRRGFVQRCHIAGQCGYPCMRIPAFGCDPMCTCVEIS